MTIQAEIQALTSELNLNRVNLEEMLRGPHGLVAAELAHRAVKVETQAKMNASQPHRDGPNSGSEPGQGPAVRTGRLRGSITWRLGEDWHGVFADIGSAVTYSVYVEMGTSRMAARPYLRPALDAARS